MLEDIPIYFKSWSKQYIFPAGLTFFQGLFIILYAFFAEYGFEVDNNTNQDKSNITQRNLDNARPLEYYYPFFQDVHVMMFIGFGFLMTFLRRYSFSSVAFNYLVAAFVLEWAILLRGYSFGWNADRKSFSVDVKSLLQADFVCAAILISFGAVLGKTNPAQLVILAFIEVVIQVWNEYLGTTYFCTYDAGESIFVHVFGAYFGLAVSFVLQLKRTVQSEKEGSSYSSDVFSMIGTLFLFCYWPSFNAGTAEGEGRLRAITNTYISICASVVLTFAVSAWVGKGKKDIMHIQNATLAGGVAVGTVADKNIGLFGAMIIGSLAGLISTLGYKYLLDLLKKINIHDTCGVHNLHGMPGFLSGLAGIVVASMPSKSLYEENLTPQCLGGGLSRPFNVHVGYQCLGLIITLLIAIVGGLLTGVILRLPIFATPDNDSYFDDSLNWHVPQDFVSEDSALGTLMKSLVPKNISLNPEQAITERRGTAEFHVENEFELSPKNRTSISSKSVHSNSPAKSRTADD